MYRKRNGSLGFSFTRFANAAVPNFFSDESTERMAELTPQRRDMFYMHQITSSNPYALDERSLYVAGIADSESVSKKVHRSLQKHEILAADGAVDTYKIGPRFTHQVARLDVHRQRDLVGMLFWWEEECQRLRKLDAEETELDGLIAESELRVGRGRWRWGEREVGSIEVCAREGQDEEKAATEPTSARNRGRS